MNQQNPTQTPLRSEQARSMTHQSKTNNTNRLRERIVKIRTKNFQNYEIEIIESKSKR